MGNYRKCIKDPVRRKKYFGLWGKLVTKKDAEYTPREDVTQSILTTTTFVECPACRIEEILTKEIKLIGEPSHKDYRPNELAAALKMGVIFR